MKRARSLALGLGLTLAAAGPAQAADFVVQGQATLTWDQPDITVAIGDTVTWQFVDTTQNHNVQSQARQTPSEATADANWNAFESAIGMPAQPTSFTFTTEGTYTYVCIVHTSTMTGVVRVGNPTPPPPPPLSAQKFGNDDASVFPAEKVELDTAKPSLKSVRARRTGRGALQVRFNVSEQSVITARIKRGGKVRKTITGDADGVALLRVRGLKAGRYTIDVRATDLAGNRSTLRKTALTVR